jgi:hypothetical protein
MGFVEWIKSENGIKIISFIWGLGFALLFQYECKKRDCLIIQSPPIDEIQKKTFSMSGSEKDCFRYEPYFVECLKK